MTLGEKLQSLRRARGLSQEQLALELGVSRQAISKWENGESTPDLEKLRAVCTFFGVTTDYLIWDSASDAPRGAVGGDGRGDAWKRAERSARRERLRSAVRKNGHWAGYAAAIVAAALLVRTLTALLSMYAVMKKNFEQLGIYSDGAIFERFDAVYLAAALPYLLLYAAMIVLGLLFARWYRRRQKEGESGHDDL